MLKQVLFFFFGWILSTGFSQEQQLFSPQFNAKECDETLVLFDAFMNWVPVEQYADSFDLPDYQFLYRSPSMGLDNLYDLWVRSDSTIVVMLRGTTANQKSLFADFYCAMMPSQGRVKIAKETFFDYKIADDSRAAVHAGFLAGFAYVGHDVRPKIDSLYAAGYKNYLIAGHSQGGSLAYYLSAWLYYLKADGVFPELKIKTYTTASPKMGNMYFVYDYDAIMRSEWSFSVTNSYDAIPEMPLTTQQIVQDINEANPLLEAKKGLKSEPLLKRMVLKSAFNKMERKASKSSKAYQKYLGKYVGKFVSGMVPELELPEPVNTTYFARPGVSISLVPNADYFEYFKEIPNDFYHHDVKAYRYLLRQRYEGLKPL